MDLLATTGTREGNRGGRDQFSWEKVKEVSATTHCFGEE